MKGNTNTVWRRVVASALALTIVASGLPSQVLPEFFTDTAIAASAANSISTTGANLQTTINNAASGSTIKVTSEVELSGTANHITVSGKTLTIDLTGITLKNPSTYVLYLDNGANVTINGGTFSGCKGAGAIYVANKSTLTINGSIITGNTSTSDSHGGGITVLESNLILNNAVIKSNSCQVDYNSTSTSQGAGVLCMGSENSRSTLKMTGGEITNNQLYGTYNGGLGAGVFALHTTFDFEGGSISNNKASDAHGGGIALNNSILNMSGDAVIDSNSADAGSNTGAGIYATASSGFANSDKVQVNINGGSITNNQNLCTAHGAAVSLNNGATLNISGLVNITGNTRYKSKKITTPVASDLISSGNKDFININISGALTSGTQIGFDWTDDDIDNRLPITNGWNSKMGLTDPSGYFVMNTAEYEGEPVVPIIVNGEVVVTNTPNTDNSPHKIILTEDKDKRYTITCNKSQEVAGNNVQFTVTTAEGYEVNKNCVKVTTAGGEIKPSNPGGNIYNFMMIAEDVTISAEPYKKSYEVSVTENDNVAVALTNVPENNMVQWDETVTFTATPANGYTVDKVTVMNGTTEIIPDKSGNTYSFKMPKGNVTVSATATNGSQQQETAKIYGHSVNVSGILSLYYYMELSDADKNAVMNFTVDSPDTAIATQSNVKPTAVTINGKTYYRYECRLNAKEMASNISASLMNGSKEIWSDKSYSVNQYAKDYMEKSDQIEGNTDLYKQQIYAMLRYGAAVQEYFGYNKAHLATEGLNIPNVGVLTVYSNSAAYGGPTELVGGITFSGVTLSYKSELDMTLYFKGNVKSITANETDVKGLTVTQPTHQGYTCISVRGIKLLNLDKAIRFTVTPEDGEPQTIQYKPEHYVYNAITSKTVSDPTKKVISMLVDFVRLLKQSQS